MTVLAGTEILQVLGVSADGSPAATTEQTTTQAIANLSPGNLSTLADGKIYVGSSGNLATQRTMSGDATISNTGVLTVAQACPSGDILVGSVGNIATAVAMSGDATIGPDGVITVAPAAGITAVIVTAKLTGGGANGSMTFTNGILTDHTDAT